MNLLYQKFLIKATIYTLCLPIRHVAKQGRKLYFKQHQVNKIWTKAYKIERLGTFFNPKMHL